LIELRRLRADEIEQLADFAIEGIRPELYPLHLDRAKVRAVVQAFIEPHQDRFQLAAFDGDRVVGAVAAAVMPMLWFERCEAHVILCRAIAPGTGRKLLGALKHWANQDMRIRRVIWPMEFHADERIAKLAKRAGFDNTLTVCSYYK